MDLRQLRVMLAVMEKGSLGKAAEWLNTSQPAVTKTIQRMEKELDVELFERRPQGMIPTLFAECLRSHAESISIGFSHALDEIRALKGGGIGLVTIASPPLVATGVLPDILRSVIDDHPGLQVRVITPSDALTQRLLDGEFDFGLDLLGVSSPDIGLEQRHLFNDQLVLIANRSNPIAKLCDPSPHELQNVKWILPVPGNLHRRRLSQFFELAGFPAPRAAIECSSTAFIKPVVAHSDYVGVIARIAMHSRGDAIERRLAIIEINSPSMVRPIGLIWRKQQVLTPSIRLVMNAVETACRKLNNAVA